MKPTTLLDYIQYKVHYVTERTTEILSNRSGRSTMKTYFLSLWCESAVFSLYVNESG